MLDKRDREEIQRLIRVQAEFEVDLVRLIEKRVEADPSGSSDNEVSEYLAESRERVEYYRGLRERCRAENAGSDLIDWGKG